MHRSAGLPPFLADDPGVDSGLMIAQYTQAAIVSELKRLAVPASVDSIPSSAMQEDHVSMGWSAGAQAAPRGRRPHARAGHRAARGGARHRAARARSGPARAAAAVIARLRETVDGPGPDRFLAPEIDAAVAFVARGDARRAAETVTGALAA